MANEIPKIQPFPGTEMQIRSVRDALEFARSFSPETSDKNPILTPAEILRKQRANAHIIFQTALAFGRTIKGAEIEEILAPTIPLREKLPQLTHAYLTAREQHEQTPAK